MKIYLFSDDMIIYTKNSKEAPKKKMHLEPVREPNKFSEYKVNMQKSITFPYTKTTTWKPNLR